MALVYFSRYTVTMNMIRIIPSSTITDDHAPAKIKTLDSESRNMRRPKVKAVIVAPNLRVK